MGIVFDIETVGFDLENLSESQQEFLLRYAEKEQDDQVKKEKTDEAERYLSLYPFTAKIISIGLLNTDTEGTLILYNTKDEEVWKNSEKNITYKGLEETEILNLFWQYISKTDKVITFNGRNFDIPFLMLRSAMLGIKPSINLISNRYNITHHIDLLDQFTFYGITRKFNLDFYCHAFGIKSPKAKGITGMEIKELYKAGKEKDIAIYCAEDVMATYELYKIWEEYLNI
ncbi:MAG: ribonuclease H-like domain-containing protein [Ignavibacteriae bacterium]|nr:ribonuclease H-like domain-containing protein [Ignavibacteriota bacterium]MCB9206784.1 ribonuclease H-like domain-containing protein [Ignavibacteriales bacterium]MCB9210208.1 ribonuclease H-like domain-containing protein [Ignavibacteriales bacterium]MCB9218407.1 ribonuclease H-like domain-containing protein [Ignavibacteriales bacterium]MCB9259587.1 ribonuclease H-like domain-containing protein [Ignavibacteriales bacterium]